MKKKVLRDLTITEISGVDRPAQAPALIRIMKNKDEEGPADFNAAVELIRKSLNCSSLVAMRKARAQHPEAFEAYQRSGIEAEIALQKALRPAVRNPSAFEAEVEKLVASNPVISKCAAMRRVADLHPELLDAYRST